MAIVGIGTDIAEIARIEKALERSGDAFASRILTESEMSVYAGLKQKGRYLAKRFAVKEAASKALGTGIAKGVTFQDFIISNDEFGAPYWNWLKLPLRLRNQKACNISISRYLTSATMQWPLSS